jgi:hypothetical protein
MAFAVTSGRAGDEAGQARGEAFEQVSVIWPDRILPGMAGARWGSAAAVDGAPVEWSWHGRSNPDPEG